MRRAILLALSLLAGCDSVTEPDDVLVQFRIDAQTCTGTGTVSFFIDGQTVGTETLAAGGTSRNYSTTAATHVLGARENAGYTWGPINVDLTGQSAYTQILTC